MQTENKLQLYKDILDVFIFDVAYKINKTGIDTYFKSKLVIGVEHVPYRNVLKPILGELMIKLGGGQMGTHVTQKERSVFTSATQVKAAPIVCYESIYGEFCTGYARNKADFLAVISNDAWWGDTQGYKQLLAYTQLRAIENRRSIVRSANTGVSCIICQMFPRRELVWSPFSSERPERKGECESQWSP